MSETILQTQRLVIRPFTLEDLPVIHRILDQTFGDGTKVADAEALGDRRSWLEWAQLSQEWFPKLYQPPYGDRAVVLRETTTLIGSVGYVPCLAPFEQVHGLGCAGEPSGYNTLEFGLYWVIDPAHQRHGYATEAAQAMMAHAFQHLHLKRVLAMTDYDNYPSQAVMRKLGMRLERNPLPDPHFLQIVGILENPG